MGFGQALVFNSFGHCESSSYFGGPGGLFVTVYNCPLPVCIYIASISFLLNGRDPRRLNTVTWLPLSSTARSRSRPLEMARAGPFVLNVAINFGVSLGLKPR